MVGLALAQTQAPSETTCIHIPAWPATAKNNYSPIATRAGLNWGSWDMVRGGERPQVRPVGCTKGLRSWCSPGRRHCLHLVLLVCCPSFPVRRIPNKMNFIALQNWASGKRSPPWSVCIIHWSWVCPCSSGCRRRSCTCCERWLGTILFSQLQLHPSNLLSSRIKIQVPKTGLVLLSVLAFRSAKFCLPSLFYFFFIKCILMILRMFSLLPYALCQLCISSSANILHLRTVKVL